MRDDLELLGSIQKSGVWAPEIYVFPWSASFPGKDWTRISRDGMHGYLLVPRAG